MAARKFGNGPAFGFAAVTKSDATRINRAAAIFVGTGGDVALKNETESASTVFKNVLPGTILPVGADYLMSTGTTASDFVLLFNE